MAGMKVKLNIHNNGNNLVVFVVCYVYLLVCEVLCLVHEL